MNLACGGVGLQVERETAHSISVNRSCSNKQQRRAPALGRHGAATVDDTLIPHFSNDLVKCVGTDKAKACLAIAEAAARNGCIFADDAGLEARLCKIKGVGPVIASTVLIKAYGKADVLPLEDKLVSKYLGERDTASGAAPRAPFVGHSLWSPWSSVVALLIWGAAEREARQKDIGPETKGLRVKRALAPLAQSVAGQSRKRKRD